MLSTLQVLLLISHTFLHQQYVRSTIKGALADKGYRKSPATYQKMMERKQLSRTLILSSSQLESLASPE